MNMSKNSKNKILLWTQIAFIILMIITAIYVLVIYCVLPYPERTKVEFMTQEMIDMHEDVTLLSFVSGGYYSY